MRFIKLFLKEGLYKKTIEFGDRTLLHSDENTQGKTTAIRLLIYSLGYNIRGVGDFNFNNKVETFLLIENDGKTFSLERFLNKLVITNLSLEIKYSFIIPTQLYEAHTFIFGDLGHKFFESMLGVFYIDQTQGSVTLNRGKIIGGINFNVDDLIISLDDKNVEEIQSEIESESKKLREYKGLFNIAKYIEENNLESKDIHIESDDLDTEIFTLKNEIKKLKDEVSKIDYNVNKNVSFIETIENFKLFVTHNNTEIPVNKNTIRGFVDNKSLLKARKDVLHSNIRVLESKLITLRKIPKNVFPEIQSYKEMIDQQLSQLNVDLKSTEDLISSTANKLKLLRKKKNKVIEHNSNVIQFMNSRIIDISKTYNLKIDKSGIRTHNVQNKSGADFFQIIIAYRIVYLLSVYKFTGIKLPLIIDSLRTSEITKLNADNILKMIQQYIPDFQVIIASVFRYGNHFIDKEIEIKNPLINELA